MTPLDEQTIHCDACDRDIDRIGWPGHESSKAHRANLERLDAPLVAATIEELKAQLAQMEQERDDALAAKARAERARDQFNPYVTVPVIYTPDDVEASLGPAALREIAERELALENKNRMKEGRPPLWSENKEQYEKIIRDLVAQKCKEMADERQTGLPNDPKLYIRMRTAKMVFPDGSMRQIPLEGTINNGAGSIADPIERYKRKGARLAWPIRCLLRDCHEAEALDAKSEQRLFGGYCSELHQRVMEGAMVEGITGRVPVLESVT